MSFLSFGQTSAIKIRTVSTPIVPEKEKNVSIAKAVAVDENEDFYKTIEIFKFNYNIGEIENLGNKLIELKNELQENSKEEDISLHLSEEEKEEKFEQIRNLEEKIGNLEKENDSLYKIYVKDYIQFRRANYGFGVRKSEAFFDLIYDDMGERFRLLTNTGFTLGENTGTLYTELITGNLGIFRTSFGAMVSSSSSEDDEISNQEEAFNRLASYGGNTVLTIEYPLLFLHTTDYQYNLMTRLIGKGTADFPEFGTTTDDFAGSLWAGIDLYGDASLSNGSMRFFGSMNLYGISGTNSFHENLAIDNSAFTFGQITLGIIIQESIKLSFVLSSLSSEEVLRNGRIIIGGQIMPVLSLE